MTEIGIDFGSMFAVVAAVRRGIDIIDNEVSKRQTSCIIGFDEKKRDIGEAGRSGWKKNFRSTFFEPKRILQTNFSNISGEKPHLGAVRFKNVDDKICADINFKGESYTLTPEQITAMMFTNIKQLSERKLNGPIADAVVSVPGYFTDNQRRAVIDAATIAGVSVLRVINDISAISLYYLYNNNKFLAETESRNVLIIDVGAANTSSSVVEFKKNSYKVVSSSYDCDLGGRSIDLLLAKHFGSRFNKKYNIDLNENPRSTIRLYQTCENVKKTLNLGDTGYINETCLFEEYDMGDSISKQEYVELIKPLLERLVRTAQTAVDKSGLTLDQIHSIEWVGGGMRVIEFQKALSEHFGRPAENHMNAEEANAFGCALQCAFLSPRVKFSNKLTVGDVQDYGISIVWNTLNDPSDTKESKLQLIKPGYNLTRNKPLRLTLKRPTKAMELKIVYDNPDELQKGSNSLIGRYVFDNVPSIDGSNEVDLRIKFKHDSNGITNLVKAEVVETKEIEVEVPEEQPKTESPKIEEPKTESQTGEKKDGDGDTQMSDAPKMVKKKKTETKYHPIQFQKFTAGLTPQQIETFKKLEEKWVKEDAYVFQVAEAKNRLETYIYDGRIKLRENWADFVTPQETETFSAMLESALSWFEEHQEESLDVYLNKLGELQALGTRFQKRFFEYEELPPALNQLNHVIETYKGKVSSAPEHIPKEKLEQIPTECDRVFGLVKELLDKQGAQPKTADPVVFSADVRERAKNLAKYCEDILNTPKPTPPPQEKTNPPPQTNSPQQNNTPQDSPKTENKTEGDKMDTSN